jgi:hypothetical protein
MHLVLHYSAFCSFGLILLDSSWHAALLLASHVHKTQQMQSVNARKRYECKHPASVAMVWCHAALRWCVHTVAAGTSKVALSRH